MTKDRKELEELIMDKISENFFGKKTKDLSIQEWAVFLDKLESLEKIAGSREN